MQAPAGSEGSGLTSTACAQALLALSVVDVYERVPNKSDADACLAALDALRRREVRASRSGAWLELKQFLPFLNQLPMGS